ncbi:phasin family protein [Thalassospira sp.]|uniref:phasin family protein n=1 Tax=Thalassospira sp. TaxID=1912094 RepID=UPI0027359E97|nr:phasin family protein [Thalassospira sp.]MDP2700100.1 phasin family protein [Thalassospira sp.]
MAPKAPEPVKAPGPKASAPKPQPVAKPAAKAAEAPLATATILPFEPLLEIWSSPEIDAMVAASQGAFEDGVAVANDAIVQITDAFSDQAGVFSDAGSRVVAQYEDLWQTQQKSWNDMWQMSSELLGKGGSFGAELVAWAQREMDASQADLEALAKVESLEELQELNARIFKRYVESGMSEAEKLQAMLQDFIDDGLATINKATEEALKRAG